MSWFFISVVYQPYRDQEADDDDDGEDSNVYYQLLLGVTDNFVQFFIEFFGKVCADTNH